jgi:ATP-dependent DNA helicase RecQ
MGRLGVDVKGRLGTDERVEPGRVIARLTDLGWGRRLRSLVAPEAPDGPADSSVLAACVDVLREWRWDRRPQAVVSVPSRRRPLLVRSVASHLADVGRLADLGALELTADAAPSGRHGGNSAFRLAGIWESWRVPADMRAAIHDLGEQPTVLLVDDLIDSRWTITVAGRGLKRAGAAQVLPFALAAVG